MVGKRERMLLKLEAPRAPGVKASTFRTIANHNQKARVINAAVMLQISDCMAEGFSLPAACGKLYIAVGSLRHYCAEHPEAQEVLDLARLRRVAALEKVLLAPGSKMPQIASRIFALKNADPENWQERPAFTPGLSQNLIIITGVPESLKDPGLIQSLIDHTPQPVTINQAPNTDADT